MHVIRSFVTLTFVLTALPIVVCAQEDSVLRKKKAREAFINGTSLQLQGERHAEAVLEFQEALRYDSSATILTAMARSYYALRRTEAAMEAVDEALRKDVRLADAWELKADMLVDMGRYDDGLAAYERIRGLNPSKRQLYTLGRLYEPRDARKAIDVFEELMAIEADEGVLLRLADLYRRLRDMEGRLRSLERAAVLDRRDADIAQDLVVAYAEAGKLDNVMNLLHTWNGVDDGTQRVWAAAVSGFLGDSLLLQLYPDTIRAVAVTIRNRFSDSWQLLSMGGILAQAIQDSVLSDSMFVRAMHVSRGSAEPLMQIASTQISVRRFTSARIVAQRGRTLFPNDSRFPFMLGAIAQEQGRIRESIGFFQAATIIDPEMIEAWLQLGLQYDHEGEPDSSEAAYERVLKIDPQNHLANNNLAYALTVRGTDIPRARELAWKAVQQYPTNPAYLDTYAWVLFRAGDADRARTYIERAISVGGNATHFEHYGDILESLGERDRAIRAWEEALRKDPERTYLEEKIQKNR